jgi:hypothetical protein
VSIKLGRRKISNVVDLDPGGSSDDSDGDDDLTPNIMVCLLFQFDLNLWLKVLTCGLLMIKLRTFLSSIFNTDIS